MKVLLIGSGGREHALAWKLAASARLSRLYTAPGSPAIATLAHCISLNTTEEILAFVRKEGIDLTVVGPEAPLVAGLADLLSAEGLKVFGPSARAAMLEGSKGFAKDFMQRHGIPTAAYARFSDAAAACAHLKNQAAPYVIKADGLAAGKGVRICADKAAAKAVLIELLEKKTLGEAGAEVVLESFLQGEEASYFVISDGKNYIPLPSAQDHKTIGELGQGPNTGGMGAYCPAPVISAEIERKVLRRIVEPTLAGMAAEGRPYQGVLYVGLMVVEGEPHVVEYNCRFGDPECQAQMLLLDPKTDLLHLLAAAAEGKLGNHKPLWRPGAAACMVMAASGYPGAYAKGLPICGLNTLPADDDTHIFHAGTAHRDEGWVTDGGRVLGITVWDASLSAVLARGYRMVERIHWPGATYRRDIGLKGVKHQRGDRPAQSVGIVLGSASDLDVARKAVDILDAMTIGHVQAVASAHRTPQRLRNFIRAAEETGVEVFIAIAGMAAALPGVVAADTLFPVIGVPVKSSAFEGMDALLSIVQMPPGVPVATVGVNGGANAGLLATHMLALKYPDLGARLREYRLQQEHKIVQAHREAGLSELI